MPPPGFSDEAESYLQSWDAEQKWKAAMDRADASISAIKQKQAAIIAKIWMMDAEAVDWESRLTCVQSRCCNRQVKKNVEDAVEAAKAKREAQAVAKFKRSAEYTKTIREEAQKLTKKQLKIHKVNILQMASNHVFKKLISYFVHTKAERDQIASVHKNILDKMMKETAHKW